MRRSFNPAAASPAFIIGNENDLKMDTAKRRTMRSRAFDINRSTLSKLPAHYERDLELRKERS